MTIKKIKDSVTQKTDRLIDLMNSAPEIAHREFVKNTPKRSGRARRNTRLRGSVIDANYNYAVPLEQGSSKQAPNGMSDPTIKYMEQYLRRQVKKYG